MLIVQNNDFPAAVRHAVNNCFESDVQAMRIATAYMTVGGCKIVEECWRRHFSEHDFNQWPKQVVAALDYGLTDPEALRYWLRVPNTELRLAGHELLNGGRLGIPSRSYHPKIYAFEKRSGAFNMVVGSANLTGRGFTANTEAVWFERDADLADSTWNAITSDTVPATLQLVQLYAEARRRVPAQSRVEVEPVPLRMPSTQSGELGVFSESVSLGRLAPEVFREMWVQVEQLQGGSRNQLELPRGAHRFFGFSFEHYESGSVELIGTPLLVSGRRAWSDRPLTWHGDNRMERINLPTVTQGGFDYQGTAILFRRLSREGFELIAAPWGSDLANSWVNASSERSRLYRLGVRTQRVCGFI